MSTTRFHRAIREVVDTVAPASSRPVSRHCRSSGRITRAAALVPVGALLGGCFHYVRVPLDSDVSTRVEHRRTRVTTTTDTVELSDATLDGSALRGTVRSVQPLGHTIWTAEPVAAPALPPRVNERVAIDPRAVTRIEVREFDGRDTTALLVTTSLVTTGIAVGIALGVSSLSFGGGFTLGGGLGRRPPGLEVLGRRPERNPLGDLFADMAELEEASIPAFETLERELAHHQGPPHLIRAARAAARDEARHAIMMSNLALRFGGEPRPVSARPPPVRTLREIAIENAVEGCVNETWGALLAHWQARASRDRAVSLTMKRIAEDETRHAELAWQIDRWARRHLDASARREVARARLDALEKLEHREPELLRPEDAAVAGLPDRIDALRILRKARETVWADV